MGVKKSVVAMIACESLRRYTAASSEDSVPTRRSVNAAADDSAASISRNSDGAILQPQPPPCENSVNLILSAAMGHVQFTQSHTVTVAQLDGFDEIIDVRSPSEFAEDHIPGAVNHPVLNNEERDRIG